MNSEKRREYIMNALKQTDRPISASKLAKELSVSRQIIVGDVVAARLRREGARHARADTSLTSRSQATSTPSPAYTISTTWKKRAEHHGR